MIDDYDRDTAHLTRSDVERDTGSLSFLVKVVQEIRLPLVEIVGFSNVIQRGVVGSNRRLAQTIHSNGSQVVDTLTSVLDLVQIESGSFVTKPTRIDIVAHAREVLEEFRPKIRERGLWLKFIDPEVPVEADVDPSALRRIVSAILSNAVNFTPKGGVTMGIRPQDGRGEVVIRDTGCGISRAFLPRVFEAFACEDIDHVGTTKGSGLGLTIAKRLMAQLGGEIRITSTRGEGTTCTASFPARCQKKDVDIPHLSSDDEDDRDAGLERPPVVVSTGTTAPRDARGGSQPATATTGRVRSPDPRESPRPPEAGAPQKASELREPSTPTGARAPAAPFEETAPSPAPVAPGRPAASAAEVTAKIHSPDRPFVLLVEDNLVTRRVMEMMLVPDYNVVSVSEVDQALSSAEEHRFDLLLLDIALNERRTGVEVLHTIRKMDGYESVPAIACTAYSIPGLKERYLEAGFSAYLAKPFRKEQLLELIETVIAAGTRIPTEAAITETVKVDLPPLPHTLTRILDLVSAENGDEGPEQVSEILEADPVVSSWVLRHANSAFYSVRGNVTSVKRAVTLIGLEPVCNLVVAEVLRKTFSTVATDECRRVYDHVLRGAVAAAAYARDLASESGVDDPDIVFTAGLIHDIGRLCLLSAEEEKYAELWYEREDGRESFRAPTIGQELMRFSIDHQLMGAEVSRAWDLPVNIDQAIRHYWEPQNAAAAYRPAVFAIAAGRAAAQLFILGDELSDSVPLEEQLDFALKGLVNQRADTLQELRDLIESSTADVQLLVDTITQA